jgi:hypothetical protein
MWQENWFGWPLKGIIWFTVAIAGACAVIGLLAGYVQKARSLAKVSHRMDAVIATAQSRDGGCVIGSSPSVKISLLSRLCISPPH